MWKKIIGARQVCMGGKPLKHSKKYIYEDESLPAEDSFDWQMAPDGSGMIGIYEVTDPWERRRYIITLLVVGQ